MYDMRDVMCEVEARFLLVLPLTPQLCDVVTQRNAAIGGSRRPAAAACASV